MLTSPKYSQTSAHTLSYLGRCLLRIYLSLHSLVFLCLPTYHKAAKAAKILASEKPEELWTEEEKRLVVEVCKQWFSNHKRYKKLQEAVDL